MFKRNGYKIKKLKISILMINGSNYKYLFIHYKQKH